MRPRLLDAAKELLGRDGNRCVFSNSVHGLELPNATTPGGSNKQPMMRLVITRPGWG